MVFHRRGCLLTCDGIRILATLLLVLLQLVSTSVYFYLGVVFLTEIQSLF